MLDASTRAAYSEALQKLTGGQPPAQKIAGILLEKINSNTGGEK